MDNQAQTLQGVDAEGIYCTIAIRTVDESGTPHVHKPMGVVFIARDATLMDACAAIRKEMDPEDLPPGEFKFYWTPLMLGPVTHTQEGLFGSIASYLKKWAIGDSLEDGTFDKPFRLALSFTKPKPPFSFTKPKPPQVQAPPVEAIIEEKVPAQSGDESKGKPICLDIGLADPGPPRVAQAPPLNLKDELEQMLLRQSDVWTREEFRTSVEEIHERHGHPAEFDYASGSHIKCQFCGFHLTFNYERVGKNRRKKLKLTDETIMWWTDNGSCVHTCTRHDATKPRAKKKHKGNGGPGRA